MSKAVIPIRSLKTSVEVEFQLTTTMRRVKEHIYNGTGIPIEVQCLQLKGLTLNDDESLSSRGINSFEPNSLQLLFQPPSTVEASTAKSLGDSSGIAELQGELQKKDQMIQSLNEQINHFISEIAEPAEPAGVDDEAFRTLREMHTEGVSEEHVKEVLMLMDGNVEHASKVLEAEKRKRGSSE